MSASPGAAPAGVDWRQVRVLLGNALRVDLRAGARGFGGRKFRGRLPLIWSAVFYLLIGMQVAFTLDTIDLQPNLFAAIVFMITGGIALLTFVVEFSDLLWAPAESDLLLWRPIAPPTLLAYRALHVFVYVAVLSLPLLVPGALCAAFQPEKFSAGVAIGFLAGGYLANVFGTLILLVVYAAILRRLPTARFQTILFGLQVLFAVVILLSQYVIKPVIENFDFTTREAMQAGIRFVPAAWFASLPEIAAAGPSRVALGSLLLALGLLALAWILSVRVLATGFQDAVVRIRAPEDERVAAEPPLLDRIAARLMTRAAAERAGFEFVMAQLRGDRSLRLKIVVGLLIPTVLTIATWAHGRLSDPFTVPPGMPLDPWAILVGYFTVYCLTAGMLTLSYSPQWKAGYIYYIAPARNHDAIQRGAYAALVYSTYLPAILLQVVCLAIAWRSASHVVFVLGPALATLPLAAAITLLRRPRPPLSVSPASRSRVGNAAEGFLLLLPVTLCFALHLQMASSPANLGLLSLCSVVAGTSMLWLQRRRNPVLSSAFEA